MRFVPLLPVLFLALCAWEPVHGQAAPPAKNIVPNGSFENGFKRDDLWDGLDPAGFLTGERGEVPALTAAGTIGKTAMPVSVSVADLNGDGLLDIAVMDVLGYLRIYFNSGSPKEPKFTVAELSGVFLSRISVKDPLLGELIIAASYARQATRMYLTDILKSGKKDLIVGNYLGEIFLISNEGTIQKPDFRQPADPSRATIPTMKDPVKRWGNIFSPCTWDWNKDGRDDLLVGEGSYSANNIHLLVNQGASGRPVFDESNRHVLAYGDGLEQLSPCVVDYNSDGQPDLLVAERSGKIALYLNSGEAWSTGKPLPEIKFASFLSSAGGSAPLNFGGISTITTGDLNGDGLFDLVVGKPNGRVALVLNTGSKIEPKFGAPEEIKGNTGTPSFTLPANWDVDYGLSRGNFYGYISIVKATEDSAAQPQDGQSCVKIGYVSSPNKICAPPTTYTPAIGEMRWDNPRFTGTAEDFMAEAPARTFLLRQVGRFRFKINATYTLSFKVKGSFTEGLAAVAWKVEKELSGPKVVRGERDAATITRNKVEESGFDQVKFSGSPTWREVTKDFKISVKDSSLKEAKEAFESVLHITLAMPQGGEAYIDDVKIVEKQ